VQVSNRRRKDWFMCHIILFSFPILGLALFYFSPLGMALPLYLGILGVSILLYHKIFGALTAKVQTGMEGMVGEEALVIEDLNPEGKVVFRNEIWTATAKGKSFLKGMKVAIHRFQGLELIVGDLGKEKMGQPAPKCAA
jgi:membrane protein implicated in regulation of membrane protease activity